MGDILLRLELRRDICAGHSNCDIVTIEVVSEATGEMRYCRQEVKVGLKERAGVRPGESSVHIQRKRKGKVGSESPEGKPKERDIEEPREEEE